jgi:hypothetical protein
MTKKTRSWFLALFILTCPFVLFLTFLVFMEEPLPQLAPLPNPNGYEDLVMAGKMLAPDTGNFNETNIAQVREIVSANVAALVLARAGLSNQCRVPVQYSAFFNSNHGSDLAPIKFLARAFIAEGRLAEMDHRPADAAKSYLDTIHLANEAARGGLLIDELVGIASEQIGKGHLQKLLLHLDARTSREAAAALEVLDAQKPTWSDVIRQEDVWSRAAFHGWRYEFLRWKERKSNAAANAKIGQKLDAEELEMRQLMIALAARAYELDKGRRPASVADLVPEYLKAVPQDPVTGTNIVSP